MVDKKEMLKVNLLGIQLDNPIIPASGTFGYGYEFAELYDINMLGTFSCKGGPSDRVSRTDDGNEDGQICSFSSGSPCFLPLQVRVTPLCTLTSKEWNYGKIKIF